MIRPSFIVTGAISLVAASHFCVLAMAIGLPLHQSAKVSNDIIAVHLIQFFWVHIRFSKDQKGMNIQLALVGYLTVSKAS